MLTSAVARRIGREPGFLDFDEVAPAIGLRAVDVREPVLACQLADEKEPPFRRATSGSAARAATARPM